MIALALAALTWSRRQRVTSPLRVVIAGAGMTSREGCERRLKRRGTTTMATNDNERGSVDLHVHGQHDAGAREDQLPAIVPIGFVIGEQFTNEQVDDSYQRLQRLMDYEAQARARWDSAGRVRQGPDVPAHVLAADFVCADCREGAHDEQAPHAGTDAVCVCRCNDKRGPSPCPVCASPATHKPSHNGSARCQSGSPASGGHNVHCSCSICF